MRRKYYVHYWKNFGNTYHLYYADSAEMVAKLPEDAEQITRKDALSLASAEKWRRKYNQSMSGFADVSIYPAGYDPLEYDIVNNRHYQCINNIWERIN